MRITWLRLLSLNSLKKKSYNLLCTTMQFARNSQYKSYSETDDVVETLQEMHKKEIISTVVKIQH